MVDKIISPPKSNANPSSIIETKKNQQIIQMMMNRQKIIIIQKYLLQLINHQLVQEKYHIFMKENSLMTI